MKSNRFFSVPFDISTDFNMRRLERKHGGIIAMGRWIAILAMLYQSDGIIDLNDESAIEELCDTLEMGSDDLESFVDECVNMQWLDARLWAEKRLCSRGVCDEIAYRKGKVDAGRNGGKTSKRRPQKQE